MNCFPSWLVLRRSWAPLTMKQKSSNPHSLRWIENSISLGIASNFNSSYYLTSEWLTRYEDQIYRVWISWVQNWPQKWFRGILRLTALYNLIHFTCDQFWFFAKFLLCFNAFDRYWPLWSKTYGFQQNLFAATWYFGFSFNSISLNLVFD